MTNRIWVAQLLIVLSLSAVVVTGCGLDKPTVSPLQTVHMKVLGILYGKFLSENRGQAPATQDQFIDYLDSKRPSWEKLANSAEELVELPHQGRTLVILYDKEYTRYNIGKTFWMAYERDEVNGKRQVINIRGDVVEMDSQQFKQVFPDEG